MFFVPHKARSEPFTENCAMPDHKFEFDFWGCKVSAQGVIGIVAAVSVVAMLLAFYRF